MSVEAQKEFDILIQFFFVLKLEKDEKAKTVRIAFSYNYSMMHAIHFRVNM